MNPASLPDALSREDLATILAVTRSLAMPFDLPTMLREVARAACQVLHAERCSVWLHDAERADLMLEVSSDLEAVRVPVGRGLVGACAATREAINVPDCYADPRFDTSVDRHSGFRTRCALTLPLVDHAGALVGVMQVLNKAAGVFEPGDVPLAEALAAQCALALSRVRMMQGVIEGERLRRELQVARSVQISTLPARLPDVEGYDIHSVFLPAEMTGGDTYDVAETEQGLLIVIGDAAGHGIAPALMVTQMHAMLRMALRLHADLETAFCQVNDQLAATYQDGRFVTAFIGLLDTRTHRLRYLSGGQSPILHYQSAARAFVRHRATSFPMGAMPMGAPRPAVTIDLAAGDLLVLMTDGVYETTDAAGATLGVSAVEMLLADHADESVARLAQRVLDRLERHAQGAAQDDDITMVLLKRGTGTDSQHERGRTPP
jgi:sigma-B regulation protein RsbU (phosphoserine phosphatase)